MNFLSLSTTLLLVLGTAPSTAAFTSQQCQDETQALSSNMEIQTANVFNSFEPNENDCSQSGNSISCSIDFATISGDFATICGNNGGQVFTTDVRMTCTGSGSTSNYLYNEFPECIGASCDAEKYEDFVGAFFEALAELSEAGDTECEIETGDLTNGDASNLRKNGGSGGASYNRRMAGLLVGMSAFVMIFL